MHTKLWEDIISNDFPEAVKQAKGVCVVPIGCLEKHGPPFPLGTDTIIASNVCMQAAQLESVVVFPTMYFGDKTGCGEFAGTVIFSLETRWHIFRETCNEIYRNGFKKILFVNGHGGNKDMLGAFTRAMLQENPNVMIFHTPAGCGLKKKESLSAIAEDRSIEYLTEEDRQELRKFVALEKATGHACLLETAKTYHYCPETVRIDRISQESGDNVHLFDPITQHNLSSAFTWMANYPNSYSGSNDYKLNDRIAKAISEYYEKKLAETFRFLKEETVSEQYHTEWLAKQ